MLFPIHDIFIKHVFLSGMSDEEIAEAICLDIKNVKKIRLSIEKRRLYEENNKNKKNNT